MIAMEPVFRILARIFVLTVLTAIFTYVFLQIKRGDGVGFKKTFKVVLMFIISEYLLAGVVVKLSSVLACSRGCMASLVGVKSYITGWVYPTLENSSTYYDCCATKLRFSVEILLIYFFLAVYIAILILKKRRPSGGESEL